MISGRPKIEFVVCSVRGTAQRDKFWCTSVVIDIVFAEMACDSWLTRKARLRIVLWDPLAARTVPPASCAARAWWDSGMGRGGMHLSACRRLFTRFAHLRAIPRVCRRGLELLGGCGGGSAAERSPERQIFNLRLRRGTLLSAWVLPWTGFACRVITRSCGLALLGGWSVWKRERRRAIAGTPNI